MKRIFITLALTGFFTTVFCQAYNMGSASIVNTCSGNFYDNGGQAGNYTNNFNDTITFCSDGPGRITVNFSAINLQAGDNLFVYYGDQAAGSPDGTNPMPGLITSSCRCITFVFISDAISVSSGWEATIGCTTPTIVENDDPMNASTPPVDGTIFPGQTNIGASADFTSGCFNAPNSVWYGFSLTGGNNSIDVVLQNATFANVQYVLMHNYDCSDGSAIFEGSQCLPASNPAQWYNLADGYYWLGVASVVSGNFDLIIAQSYNDYCGDNFCGPGESCLTCPFDCGICPEAEGGPYFHPISGMQNTRLGQCLVSTSTGNYYDNGGPGMTYASNIDQIYRTFCPSSPLNSVQATIKVIGLEYTVAGCTDQLFVRNGPSQTSSLLWSGCGNSMIPTIRTTNGVYGSGVFTSTHQSGCLTFSFRSDAVNTGYWEGWEILLKEVPFAGGPNVNYNNDCDRAIPLCNDYTVSSQMYGPGLSSESCSSCALAENFSEWYKVKVSSGGIMEFEITPLGNSDMDFAIFRADSCGDITSPIRCSHAAYQPPGKTGLSMTSGDMSEDIKGDQWVAELPIEDNETYYILINECNKVNPNSYTLDFKLSGGASFDCSIVLPVAFLDFSASLKKQGVELVWKTASENNNDFFTVERSIDGENFEPLASVDGSGNSNEIVRYIYIDQSPVQGLAYYRIKQTDFDGMSDYSQILPVDFLDKKEPWVAVYPSPAAEIIHISTDELSIEKEYKIFNAIGVEIQSGQFEKTEFDLPVLDLDDGMYYFSMDGAKQVSFLVSH